MEEYASAAEQEIDYGLGAAEVQWAARKEDTGKLNLANLPIQLAIKDASLMSAEEFAMIRRKGFGGSDASVLVGANPYTKTYEEVHNKYRGTTTDSLVKQKARLEITEEEKGIGRLSAVRKGNELEPLIILKANEVFGIRILKPDDMYRFKDHPYLTMNFDGVGIFLKPKGKDLSPTEYVGEVEDLTGINLTESELYEGKREVQYPIPDFTFVGKHHGYAPVEIKVATFTGQKNYNTLKSIYSEDRLFRGQNPWIEAPKPLVDAELMNMSVEAKAAYFGIPKYYYPQVQQEMMAVDANGGFLAVLFEQEWTLHIFYVQKDPYVQNRIIIEGLKAARAVNKYMTEMGLPPSMALTPEMSEKLNLKTNLPQEAAADKDVELVKAPEGTIESEIQKEIDPRWVDTQD